jgi:hypothetical protein
MTALWQIARGQQLVARDWGDEYVLLQLRRAPASMADLVDCFAGDMEPDDLIALPETVAALLAQLEKMYLVVTVAAPC